MLGAEYAIDNSSRSTYPLLVAVKPSTTVGNPGSAGIGGNLTGLLATQFRATTLGLYLQDTIDLAKHWKLVGGLRLDNSKGDYQRTGNAAPNNTPLWRSDSLPSKRLGHPGLSPSRQANPFTTYRIGDT